MAKSDFLVSLVKAAVSGDRAKGKTVAEALIADERAKNHHMLAEKLQRIITTVEVSVSPPPPLSPITSFSRSFERDGKDIVSEINPSIRLEDLILPLPVRKEAEQLLEEHFRSNVLRAHGYEPRHRILLSGPPGNGKTSFAEAIAEGLGLSLYIVRYDVLVGSYLGETNTRLRNLFDYIRSRPCVLFFDEFDAIGKERGDIHESGEIKRVVSFLLMQFDTLPSYVITIAATNHAELLDRAVWRRFQMRLGFPTPTDEWIAEFIQKIISSWPEKPKISSHQIGKKIKAANYAEVRDFCHNVRRKHILGLGNISIDDALNTEVDLWNDRIVPGEKLASASDSIPPFTSPSTKRTKKGSR